MSAAKVIPVIKMRPTKVEKSEEAREEIRCLIENIVGRMLGSDEGVKVTYFVGERTTVYKVECPDEHLGRLIGAKGKNIMGLRDVVSAVMWPHGIRAIVEIPFVKREMPSPT